MSRALESHVLTFARAVASRVELRQQDVADLTDETCYDLARIPTPFVPELAFGAGVGRIVAALRPGGLLMIRTWQVGGTDLNIAITREQ